MPAYGQGSNADRDKLDAYFKDFNNTLYGLIQVSKKGKPAADDKPAPTSAMYRLLNINCAVYEEIDPFIPFERADLEIDMTYRMIDELGNYVALQNRDLSFWVNRDCVRQVLKNTQTTRQSGGTGSDRQWSTLTKKIYERHLADYTSYKRYIKKLSKRSDYSQYQTEIKKITIKHQLIEKVYEKINISPGQQIDLAFMQKVKINGQLLFGNSTFNTEFTDLSTGDNSSENIDVQLNASYAINSESRAHLKVKNRTETLLTPYNNWNLGAGYDLNYAGHALSVGGNFELYQDDNLQVNDYDKISFNATVRKTEPSSFNYTFNYQFLDQSFDQVQQNSYSRHQVRFRSDVKASSSFSLQPGLIYNLGNSDNAFFEYSFINPTLTLLFNQADGTGQLNMNYEHTSFSNLDVRNNDRFHLEWATNQHLQNLSSRNNQFGVIYRKFSEADQSDYLDVYSKLNFRNDDYTKRFMVRYRHFPNISKNDRLDIRQGLDQGGDFYLGYDMNVRLHYPTDDNFFSRLDGYFKLGADINGVRVGPFLRWHLAVDFKNTDLGILNKDQNSYQYGLESSGYFKIAKKGRLRYRASYDLNTVFSRAIDPTDPSMALDAETRHPSNLQIDLDVGVQVMQYLEIFGVVNYFSHDTDFEEDINTNFIMNNTGNRFKLGVRINYN